MLVGVQPLTMLNWDRALVRVKLIEDARLQESPSREFALIVLVERPALRVDQVLQDRLGVRLDDRHPAAIAVGANGPHHLIERRRDERDTSRFDAVDLLFDAVLKPLPNRHLATQPIGPEVLPRDGCSSAEHAALWHRRTLAARLAWRRLMRY